MRVASGRRQKLKGERERERDKEIERQRETERVARSLGLREGD